MDVKLDPDSLVRFRILEIDMQRGRGVCAYVFVPALYKYIRRCPTNSSVTKASHELPVNELHGRAEGILSRLDADPRNKNAKRD